MGPSHRLSNLLANSQVLVMDNDESLLVVLLAS